MNVKSEDFTDQEAVTAIIRITGGNFRLIHILLMQLEQILRFNEFQTVIKERESFGRIQDLVEPLPV
jgi:hypothetical protein